MKIRLAALVSLLTFTAYFATAQDNRCGTSILHQKHLATDPPYRAYYEKVTQRMQEWIKEQPQMRATAANTAIPVVVHVLYGSPGQNISNGQIVSQINVLNADFTATNNDISKVPIPFKSVIGDVHVTFCLASVDPHGNATTGIERRQTADTSFGFEDNRIKFYNQ